MANPHPNADSFARLASAVEGLAALPALPTLDWCDRAAAAIARLAPAALVSVLLGEIDDDGNLSSPEAWGVAAAPDRGATLHPNPDLDTMSIGPLDLSSPNPAAWTDPRAKEFGERLARPGALGWQPRTRRPLRPDICLIPFASRTPRFASSRIARLCDAGFTPDAIVAFIRLCPDSANRGVLVVLAFPAGRAKRRHLELLRPALVLLGRRAVAALGTTTRPADGWVSPREQLVLDHLVLGRSVPEIAAALGRSIHTVSDQVKRLHRKLGCSRRAELVARALGLHVPAATAPTPAPPDSKPETPRAGNAPARADLFPVWE